MCIAGCACVSAITSPMPTTAAIVTITGLPLRAGDRSPHQAREGGHVPHSLRWLAHRVDIGDHCPLRLSPAAEVARNGRDGRGRMINAPRGGGYWPLQLAMITGTRAADCSRRGA